MHQKEIGSVALPTDGCPANIVDLLLAIVGGSESHMDRYDTKRLTYFLLIIIIMTVDINIRPGIRPGGGIEEDVDHRYIALP